MRLLSPGRKSVVRLLFAVAWSLGVLATAFALLMIWAHDYRFGAIGGVLLVPTAVAAFAGAGVRSSQLDWAAATTEYRRRVRERRPIWVLAGSTFGLLAVGAAIAAIWLRFADLGVTSVWLSLLALWSFGMCAEWDG
jgi:hypothetical protein